MMNTPRETPIRNNSGRLGDSPEISNKNTLKQNKVHKNKDKEFQQFYSENVGRPGETPLTCMESWGKGVEKRLTFVENIFDFCDTIANKLIFIIYRCIMSVLVIAFLIIQYVTDPNNLEIYLITSIAFCIVYLLTIILLKILRLILQRAGDTGGTNNCDLCFTIWYYIIAFALMLSFVALIVIAEQEGWELTSRAFFWCTIFLLIADAAGMFIVSFPLILLILLEKMSYTIIYFTCGALCRKKEIPGVTCPPDLYLKKHEKELARGGGVSIKEGSSCPICLGVLREGQFVVSLPCGEEHIFHRHCITIWLVDHNVCPTCRAEFDYQGDISVISIPPPSPLPPPRKLNAFHFQGVETKRVLVDNNHPIHIRDPDPIHIHHIPQLIEESKEEIIEIDHDYPATSGIKRYTMIEGRILRSVSPNRCIYIYIYNLFSIQKRRV